MSPSRSRSSSWASCPSRDRSSELELEQVVARGTFGKIYRGRYLATSSTVAVKVAPESEEVRNEIHFLSKCSSPFTVGYFGSFVNGSDRWVITEYCGGGFVTDVLKKVGRDAPFPEQCIQAVCAGALAGLNFLHSIDVCHRDLRCSNILLTNAGYIKLTGFTSSAELDRATKKCTSVAGSPRWRAPEVAACASYDGKADIWSLGITTIELAEGVPRGADATPLRALRTPHTESLRDFVEACCKRDPDERADSRSLMAHPFVNEDVACDREGLPLFPWCCFDR